MNLYVLQELGILLGVCLTVKNLWELLTGDVGGIMSLLNGSL